MRKLTSWTGCYNNEYCSKAIDVVLTLYGMRVGSRCFFDLEADLTSTKVRSGNYRKVLKLRSLDRSEIYQAVMNLEADIWRFLDSPYGNTVAAFLAEPAKKLARRAYYHESKL